jgi:cold shock CspA family protein
MEEKIYEGIVTKNIYERGYGFIQCNELEQDIWYHVNDAKNDVFPDEGSRVQFKITDGRKGKKAINVEKII